MEAAEWANPVGITSVLATVRMFEILSMTGDILR
jgi:hypothetical protein